MKASFLFFFLSIGSVLAVNTYSQATNFTIKASGSSVKEVIAEIEKNSEFIFFYLDENVDLERKVSVNVKDKGVEVILDKLFENSNSTYHVSDRQIIISKKETPPITIPVPTPQQQGKTVTGTVSDSYGVIVGANIVVKGTTIGTVTDTDGKFSLNNVPANAVLQISYVGYKTQEITVANQTHLNITIVEDSETLGEVVVVGYGSGRRVGTTIGSMQQVTATKLQARPAANVLDALQGQVAGLQVYSNSGEPGTTQQIVMHGNGSLGAESTLLYIVDGIVADANSIVAMNPNDFESVTLLKDASATSIYGARAANGVMVITTKRGTRNGDAKITLRTQYGISKLADRKFYNQIMSSEELLSFLGKSGLQTQEYIDNVRKNPAFIDPKTGQLYNTRWVDEVMRDNTPTSQTDISVQGGGEKTTYFLSGSYFDQTGTSWGSEYKRYTVRSNVESQVKSWLKLGLNVLASRDTRQMGTDGSNVEARGMYLYRTHPWITPVDPSTGKIWEGTIPGANYPIPHLKYTAEKDVTMRTNSQLIGNFSAEITPFKGFKIISRSGTDMRYYLRDRQRVPSYNFGTSANNGLRSIGNERMTTMTTNNVMEYNFDINKKHFITLLAGQEGVSYEYTSDSQEGQGITDDRLMEMRSGMNSATMGSSSAAYQFLSFFGRADYNYDDRFFADFSVRNDASSRFGQENQSAIFWSAGAMWNMKKEHFLESVGILTDARLKASYGTQGNAEIGNYDHLALTGAVGTYNGEDAWAITTVGNPAMTWEQQSKLTVGLRVELANRYSIGLDFYNRKTTNMLMWVPSPRSTGFDGTTQNVGAYQNRGFDLNIGMNFVRTKDYYAGANIVFNYNKDKILELYQGNTEMQDWRGFYHVVGQSLTHYWPLNAGIDPEDGKQMWYLPGENIHETTRDKSRTTKTFNATELKQNTGKTYNTPISGGFGLNGGWKGFSVSADFSFMLGRWLWENTSIYYTSPTVYNWNQFKEVADFWTPENRDAKYPSWKDGQALQMDDFLLSNASFMRLKNLTVSYTFDKKLLEKTKVIAGLRLFVTGRNLWTVTNYIGIDPENQSYGYFQSQVYPNSKQYQAGLEIVF